MPSGSLRVGRIAGIPIRVHWSVIIIALLFGLNPASQFGVVARLAVGLAVFASILLHELGHAFAARRYGISTKSIDLWALGGFARIDREAPTPRADGVIAAAGPLVNFVIGAVSLGAAFAFRTNWLASIALVNLSIAVFNMLPGAPLDGGRVLRAVRWSRTGNKYRAMREAGNAGRVLGWSMAIGGLGLTMNGYSGFVFTLTGVFIALNAHAEVVHARLSEQLDGIKVRDLTWFGIAHAGSDMDADSMIDQRSRLGEAGAVAVDSNDDGELDGIVLEEQLWSIPPEQRAWVMLNSMIVPFSQTAQAGPDEDLSSVLPRLNPIRPLVTVWNDGQLLGVVPPKRLKQLLDRATGAAGAT